MAFPLNPKDDVNVIRSISHRRIRLREILLVLPQASCGRNEVDLKEMPDGISFKSEG